MSTKFIFLILLIAVFVHGSIACKAQGVDVQDSLALVDLYNSTNGDGWINHANWLTSVPVSQWDGIIVVNGRVKFINLSVNNLYGSIPASIENLANLNYLDLSINHLFGNIPKGIGNLINLQLLYLYSNELNGSIPSEIGNLKSLNRLYLNTNQLSDSIPSSLANLKNLDILALDDNHLTGSIPPELGNLTILSTLALDDNQLSGNIPPELSNLKYLRGLYLHNNQLNGSIPPELCNIQHLSGLSLYKNRLTGNIPSQLGKLVDLTALRLDSNQLIGSIPAEIGNLPNLFWLYLNDNQLSGVIPTEFGNLKNLQYLYLNNNQLSGTIPASITNLPFTYSLDIFNNHFTFDGMELVVKKHDNAAYSPQAIIPIHQNNNSLYISAGGTLNNNTYKWFMAGQPDSTVIEGDSVFFPLQNGKYYATVTNSICTKLTLYTDTIEYGTVLPVTIANLKAKQNGSIIKVDWSSLTEINVSYYEIQHSINAHNFFTIGTVTANKNVAEQQNYSFIDLKPIQGNNYYRLKVIDKDGKINYSSIVSVNITNDKTVTLIYPNPAKDLLHLQTNGVTSFSLINQAGKILITTNINGTGDINIAGFAAGLYYLKNNNNDEVQKVIIVK